MRHFDLLSVVDAPQSDRIGGQPESKVGQERDARQAQAASVVKELKSLRPANEAAIAWTKDATRCATLAGFEVSLANLRKVVHAIEIGEMRIAEQEMLVRRMSTRGWPTATAHSRLETMQSIQATLEHHRQRLEEEIDLAMRSVDASS
jgi:hypothetical protein